MSNIREIADYVVMIFAGIGAIFIGFRRAFKNFDFHFRKSLESSISIEVSIEKARLLLNADRVDIITCSNGGGKPKPGSMIYASLMAEAISKQQERYIGNWQNVACDAGYLNILLKAYNNGFSIVDVSEMEDGILANAVNHMDINTMLFSSGFSKHNKHLFVVVSWNENHEIDMHDHEIVRITKEEIRSIVSI